MTLAIFTLAFLSVALNSCAQICLRQTMLALGSFPAALSLWPTFSLRLMSNLWFLGGLSCYLISLFLWLAVLGKLQVSQAYPLLSLGYVLTAVVGYFFMHEDVNLVRIAGLALIIAGIIVISRS